MWYLRKWIFLRLLPTARPHSRKVRLIYISPAAYECPSHPNLAITEYYLFHTESTLLLISTLKSPVNCLLFIVATMNQRFFWARQDGESGICLTDIHEAQTATSGGCPGSRPNFFKLRLISTAEPWFPDCTLKHFRELKGTLQIHWIFEGNSDISQMTHEPPAGGRQLTISTLDPDMPFKISYFCNWHFRSYGKM